MLFSQHIKKQFVILCISLTLSISVAAEKIKVENNFPLLSQQMQKRNLVLILEFYAKYCMYCRRLEDEILYPLQISGDYAGEILIRKIAIDSSNTLINFHKKKTTSANFAAYHNVTVTPTVLFLNAQGKEISERIVGINTAEMYGAYLDAAIDEARTKITQQSQNNKVTSTSSSQNKISDDELINQSF